ncbi:MAG: hypothetical protein ACTHJP_07455 [Rhodanobacteraceae bacterium]
MHTARAWLSALAIAALYAGAAHAADNPGARTAATAFESVPVSDARLAACRGGFDLGGGLVASFGIDRAVYINGNLVASVSVNIPDLARIDSAQANALAMLANSVTLIHNGPGNFVDPASFNRATGAIVIQNTLDNQQIQALTTLNTTVRNLSQFNSLNVANSLQQALINSRGQ